MKPDRKRAKAATSLPGGRAADPVYEADPDGRPVVHQRVVDTIGLMLRPRVVDLKVLPSVRMSRSRTFKSTAREIFNRECRLNLDVRLRSCGK